MRHIADSTWTQLFLYNSDSLTLPIFRQALNSKAPLMWVSSSQFLLFPEGLVYAISSILTDSIRASLVFNAYLNVVILYVLIRWTLGQFKDISNIFQRIFSLSCCLLLIFYMVLERRANINSSSIATLFLFTTYYYGVMLSGVALLGIILFQLKYYELSVKVRIVTIISFLLASLSTFSDPLFAIEVLLPLIITIILVFILSNLKFRKLLLISLPPIIGGIIGYVARSPFHYFIGQSTTNHISTYDIPITLTIFHDSIKMDLSNLSGSIELFLILLIILFSLVYSLIWIYKKIHFNPKRQDIRLLILSMFSFISSIWAITFSILGGSETTRYLTLIAIFPLLGLIPLLYLRLIKKWRKYIIIIFSVMIVAIAYLGISSLKDATKLLSTSTYQAPSCLAKALNYKPAYGVGSYWTVRPLDLYGKPDEQALQVMPNLAVFPWQANAGAYDNKTFTFILVNKVDSFQSITSNDIYLPPDPSKISSCNSFYVYQYAVHSKGYRYLNKTIQQTYKRVLTLRSSDNLASSNYF